MRHVLDARSDKPMRMADSTPFYDTETGAAYSDLLSQSAASIYYERLVELWTREIIRSGNYLPLTWKLPEY